MRRASTGGPLGKRLSESRLECKTITMIGYLFDERCIFISGLGISSVDGAIVMSAVVGCRGSKGACDRVHQQASARAAQVLSVYSANV